MTTRIKLRRDIAANWTEVNPILAAGEPGLETDTSRVKYGDGTTAWSSLDYSDGGDSLTADKAVTVTVGNTDYFAIVNRANNDDDGVESSAVAYDSEGNLITLHITEVDTGPDGYQDRLIISKFDSAATLIWQKQIQEEMDVSQAHDVCIDSDDNIIVVFSQDNGAGDGSNDDTVSAIKYTPAGSELWKKDYHPAVVVTINDGFSVSASGVTVGSFNGTTVDVVSIQWDYAYLSENTGWSLQESSDDGATWTTIAAVLGFGAYDNNTSTTPLYIAANSPVEIIQGGSYAYRVTRQGPNSLLELSGAVTDSTHTFIAARYEENTGGGNTVSCIMKISNSNGSLVWAKTFSFSIDPENEPYGMEIDPNGDLVVVGAQYTGGPTFTFVSKFNGASGAEVWTRILSTETYESTGGDVTADSQGNVFVSINARIQIVHEDGDTYNRTAVYITKLNSSGVIQWTRRVGPGPCASIGTGIDCDATGNVYLSALTTVQKNPNRENQNNNTNDITDTRDVLAIAKYSTSGAVLWQRYLEANGYEFYQSRSAADGVSNFEWNENSGRNLSVSAAGKIAVQVTVLKYDLDDDVPNSRYWESITFQIDQDGREMTIGSADEKFTVKASRIPGKLVTLIDIESVEESGPVTVTVATLTPDVEVTTPTITYAEAELAQQIIKSAPYEYVFGNDGTLTIPNDGDIKLVQTQIGWFSIFGQVDNDNFNVWNRANCVDTATGDVYVTGQENDEQRGFVARYNSAGELLWSIRLYDNEWGSGTRGNAIKMHPVTGNVTVLAEFAGGENSMVLEIDPDTAQIVNQIGFKDSASGNESYANTEAYDFDFQSDGSIVAVGRKYDEPRIDDDMGGEAFVWTNRLEGWTKVVGSLNPNASERYFSVATGSDGSIYAAGEIFTDDSSSNYQAVVSKFNSSGAHQWSRVLNTIIEGTHSGKCVAVRGTTVVVSSYNDQYSDTVITKLDTSGNILWQRQTDSGDDSSVAIDTNGDIYAVAEGYFENKYNNIIKVIRFASNGEPIWRKFFGTLGYQEGGDNEYFKNGRNITLDAEHFYVSGYTTAFDADAERAFLVKLPKSGDCDGYYGSWTVQTEAYDVDKVNVTEANTFTPNIRNGNFQSWSPDIESNWWDPSNNSSYQTLQPIVDRDGGAIEFADGSRQTSSAQQIPQLKISNVGRHRLCLDDMGKHIYVTNSNNSIIVPYHLDNPLPIGFTVVIVNSDDGPIQIEGDGNQMDIIVPGVDTARYWELDSPGMATLIKVEKDVWFMTGNVTVVT